MTPASIDASMLLGAAQGIPATSRAHIYPTIGRRVWYWPSKQEVEAGLLAQVAACTREPLLHPMDAGICYVHSADRVNLTVADHDGVMHARKDVFLAQPGDEVPRGEACATWMDYQIQQAIANTAYVERHTAEVAELRAAGKLPA